MPRTLDLIRCLSKVFIPNLSKVLILSLSKDEAKISCIFSSLPGTAFIGPQTDAASFRETVTENVESLAFAIAAKRLSRLRPWSPVVAI